MANLYRANYNSSNEYRGEDKQKPKPKPPPKKKKTSFKQMKKNTISSLNDVEKFLGDFQRFTHYVQIYKFFK